MIVYLFCGFLGYYVVSSIASWYRLRHFKGPFLASFTNIWLSYSALTGRSWKTYQDICEKYGSLARLSADTLITDDPELIRRMSAARSPYQKSGFYEAMRLNPHQHTTFSTLDKAYHDQLKSKTIAAYSGRDVPGLESTIDSVIGQLQQLIRSKYISGAGTSKPMNLADVVHFFTLDLLSKIAYGREFGHLDSETDVHGWIRTFATMSPFFQLVAELPWLRRILLSPLTLRMLGPKRTDSQGIGKIMGLARGFVDERFISESKEQQDMLGSFVRHGLNEDQCESEVLLLIIAGSDNTSGTIRATMLYLMTNINAYRKVQQEIDQGIAKGLVSTPITQAEAKQLPYLQAVILEGLRIFSPSGSLLTKKSPPEGDVFKGQRIPGGVNIGQSTWAMLRRRDIFGEDADLFRPERFLEADPQKREEMEKVVDLNFGYGRWGCSGKPVALMELNKVFVELLRYFDFQLCNPDKPWDAKTYPVLVIKNMWVRVTERPQVDQ